MMAMPVMTVAVPVERAVVIMAVVGTLSTWWQVVTLRSDIDRWLATRLTAATYMGMPVGLVVLNVVDDRWLRIGVGSIVLVAAVLLVRRTGLNRFGPGLDYSMGLISGIFSTSVGLNGPPLVFGLQSHDVDPARFRATIAVVFAVGNIFALGLFAVDDKFTADGMRAAGVAIPAALLGTVVGGLVRPLVPDSKFRSIVIALLVVAGVSAIAAALF